MRRKRRNRGKTQWELPQDKAWAVAGVDPPRGTLVTKAEQIRVIDRQPPEAR